MFGFSKIFAICILIAVIISFGMRNYWIGVQIVMAYAFIKIIWNILTLKHRR